MTTAQSEPEQKASITEVSPDTFVDSSGQQLDEHQIRAVVTPHVFAVAPELIGRPLAKPMRRGVALMIDGFFISTLTSGSLLFLLPMLAYLAWARWQVAKYGQMALLLTVGLVMFASNHWLPKNISEFGTTVALEQLEAEVDSTAAAENAKPVEDSKPVDEAKPADTSSASTASSDSMSWWQRLQRSDHTVLKWIQGILSDLGIGFGWAVGYFTLFIAWNNGQTIGKRMCGIRVVQLDNTPLSLWGAFGRQGGYSAGFATGLLGFLQIYWDPNRQAIQDKLADTLVLREE